MFMGDTGSLAIGGVIGLLAVMVRQEALLLLVGGVFVMEALSVMLQVASSAKAGRKPRSWCVSGYSPASSPLWRWGR